jgi:2-phosphosulfolactate phosphatase
MPSQSQTSGHRGRPLPTRPKTHRSELRRTVAIGCFSEGFEAFGEGGTTVAIDVIRATTTAVTGVALGRRCYPVGTLDDAERLSHELDDPLLVGELGGEMPYGFDITNSPAQLADRSDSERPMILVSTSGTRLITSAPSPVFVACLRNYEAQIDELVRGHPQVVLVGAGTRGEFREEDQLCCSWIGAGLLSAGYEAVDETTTRVIERWRDSPAEAFVGGKSTEYLRETQQLRDLEFILGHINDLPGVFVYNDGEVAPAAPR